MRLQARRPRSEDTWHRGQYDTFDSIREDDRVLTGPSAAVAPYDATETFIRDAAGHIVVFAQFAA